MLNDDPNTIQSKRPPAIQTGGFVNNSNPPHEYQKHPPLTAQLLHQQQYQQQAPVPGLNEQSLSGSYYSDEDFDGESSEDESPRENRVLTFADEHGKNLVAIHWYEPDPGEDNRSTAFGHIVQLPNTDDHVEAGCGGKCIIL